MKSKQELEQDEERIRALVHGLSDKQRSIFYSQVEENLKDPDTYAALNFIFIAGLHHFYLGKMARGTINIVIFLIGIAWIIAGYLTIGIAFIIAVSAVELGALFQAQKTVKAYNNKVMQEIYQELIQKH